MNYTGTIYIRKSEKVAKSFCDLFLLVCVLICVFSAIFNILFFPAEVIGLSMYPTINQDYKNDHKKTDLVYASKFFGYNKGDIVIVDLETIEDDAIKRLIALGGDMLGFGSLESTTESTIYLNNKILVEDYLQGNSNVECVNRFKSQIKNALLNSGEGSGFTVVYENGMYQMKLDDDHCIFLGDNRAVSQDCSSLGPQKISSIHARVFIIVPYGYNLLTYWSHQIFGKKQA